MAEDKPREGDNNVVKIAVEMEAIEKAAPEFRKMFNNALRALSRGIGTVYAPTGAVREARAQQTVANIRADTAIELEQKRQTFEALRAEAVTAGHSLKDRAFERLIEDTTRTQENRESVATFFVEDIGAEAPEKDADGDIDDDWLTRFWETAEKSKVEDVQRFYAHLLAREVMNPGGISQVTLFVLATLAPEVAKMFEQFCRISIDVGDEVFVVHPHVYPFGHGGPLDAYGLTLDDLFDFETFGLIRSAITVPLTRTPPEGDAPIPVVADLGGTPIEIHWAESKGQEEIQFTRAGAEIRRALKLQPHPSYLPALQEKFPGLFIVPELTDEL
jgi:hypothetical protein